MDIVFLAIFRDSRRPSLKEIADLIDCDCDDVGTLSDVDCADTIDDPRIDKRILRFSWLPALEDFRLSMVERLQMQTRANYAIFWWIV